MGKRAQAMERRQLKKLRWPLLLIGVLFLALVGVRSYNSYRFHVEKQIRFMMDTFVTICAVGPEKRPSRAIDIE